MAEKALKEVSYHLRWSSEWVIRLGDGTEESHQRMNNAMNELWKFTEELFIPVSYEIEILSQGILFDLESIRSNWSERVFSVLNEATISIPEAMPMYSGEYGKQGFHSEQLTQILSEMQLLQRAYPGCEW